MFEKVTIAFVLAVCFSTSAPAQQTAPENFSPDARAFLHAVMLSYDGKHDAARPEFAKYKHDHPDDLLSPLRLSYDYLFDHRSKMSKAEYHSLLHKLDDAIALFESKKCVGTDLAGIAGNTIDCDYVGAALYSSRMALRFENESLLWGVFHLGPIKADNSQFFSYAKPSANTGILQSQFLLGVHEYKTNQSDLASHDGDPNDRTDALTLIKASLPGTSPFVDDQWFFVLDFLNHNPNDADTFFKEYPRAAVVARLHAKYPDNGMTR